jgi:molybdopterin synthase catalytic subunit
MAIKVSIIKDEKLPSLDNMVDQLKLPECGAVAVFQGITRNNINGKKVVTLHYECYEEMAIKELHKLGA